jgi:aspartate/methionine/tyrosine aminotransferase
MFEPTRYLQWARRFYGRVRFDLATSGMPSVRLAELGPLPSPPSDSEAAGRLREAVATYNGVPAEEAIAALGTTQALWLAYASLTQPGDEVLVEEPGYEPLVRIAEGVGARVTHFSRPADNGFALDAERIEKAMTPRTRLVVVTNLHNPSGVRAPNEALRAVARVAQTHGAHLLVDEVYAPFDTLVDERGVFLGTARKLAPNVISVSSLSKCYGLALERVGWLLGSQETVERADDAMASCCGLLPLAHAHVGLHAFARIVPLARRARAILDGKRARVAAWVASHRSSGVTWSAPDEGLFALITVSGAGDLTPFIEAMITEREVLVAPGIFFGVPNGFRLAWSAPIPNLDEGLARLGDALAGLGAGPGKTMC